jgi:hypothetical protein
MLSLFDWLVVDKPNEQFMLKLLARVVARADGLV